MTDAALPASAAASLPKPRPAEGSRDGAVRLLPAKLARPQTPPSYVVRRALHQALDDSTDRPVSLVCGGPGWGKTLLAASWAATQTRRTVAWLALDADDNEPRVFWTYVIEALRASG